MKTIGLDIGSTSTKYVVLEDNEIFYYNVIPTGWSSTDAAASTACDLTDRGIDVNEYPCVSTGYGRSSVPFANKSVTEITCHGKGADYFFGSERSTVIDIGGQDTKVILIEGGIVLDFIMNDKCSAGTGRFLEVMASALGMNPSSLCTLAEQGSGVTISSMCTVFAESEVISLISQGIPKKDIAYGIVDSITNKVVSQCGKQNNQGKFYLTGGLCECPQVLESISKKLGTTIQTCKLARYAGAVGAALCAQNLDGKKAKTK